MAMIAAAIAAGIWPQQVRRRPKLLRIGCAMIESDWLALRLTDQQVRDLVIEFFCSASGSAKTERLRFTNPNYPLRSNSGVQINDFAKRNAQRKDHLICDLAHCLVRLTPDLGCSIYAASYVLARCGKHWLNLAKLIVKNSYTASLKLSMVSPTFVLTLTATDWCKCRSEQVAITAVRVKIYGHMLRFSSFRYKFLH